MKAAPPPRSKNAFSLPPTESKYDYFIGHSRRSQQAMNLAHRIRSDLTSIGFKFGST